MKINVTRHDIHEGTPENRKLCAVSHAVCRALCASRVETDHAIIRVFKGGVYEDYYTPQSVVTFIDIFDTAPATAQPFSFTLT